MPRSAVISLRHLEGVAALCRTRSFGAAAREVSLTQSALTQAVAGIERRLDRKLFDRGPRGTRPTPAAEKLAESIQRVVDLLNRTGREALPPSFRRAPFTRRVSVTQLLALTAVERAGSFRRGARDSGLSEPSIHRAVRALEAALNAELIIRTRTGVQATQTATAICEATRRAMAELETAFAAIKAGVVTNLTIGATPTVRAGLLSEAIADLHKRDPNLRFRIEEAPRAELMSGLLGGKFDLVLCPSSSKVPEGVFQHYVFEEVLHIVARHDHPLAKSKSAVKARTLAEYPWIANPPGSPRRGIWEMLFRTAGVEPPMPLIECKSSEASRELLMVTNTLAMLAPDQFRVERECGLFTVIGGAKPIHTRKIVITTRASWVPDVTESLLIDILRQLGADRRTPESEVMLA